MRKYSYSKVRLHSSSVFSRWSNNDLIIKIPYHAMLLCSCLSYSTTTGSSSYHDNHNEEERGYSDQKAAPLETHFPLVMTHLTTDADGQKIEHRVGPQKGKIDIYANKHSSSESRKRKDDNDTESSSSKKNKKTIVRGIQDDQEEKSLLRSDVLEIESDHSERMGGTHKRGRGGRGAEEKDEVVIGEMEETFGDTPLHLIDMLAERLGELRDEKVAESKSSTYMPRRLFTFEKQLQVNTLIPEKEKEEGQKEKKRTRLVDIDQTLNDTVGFNESSLSSSTILARKLQKNERMANQHLRSKMQQTGFGTDVLPKEMHQLNDPNSDPPDPSSGALLLRAIQRAGVCSRRMALQSIASGKVKIDGVEERNPFTTISADNDIHVEGHRGRLRFAAPRLWMFHKPSYCLVTHQDHTGRSAFANFALAMGHDHLVPVGTLPYKSHGLLLLTNDGELSRYLEHPSTNIIHAWRFRVRPAISPQLAYKINSEGVHINGIKHTGFHVSVDKIYANQYSVTIKTSGKPTVSVYQLLQHLGRRVIRGGRVSVGVYRLRNLNPGAMKEVAIPQRYLQYTNPIWKSFVERDWPYFRKLRIRRLKYLSKFRILTFRERDELDTYSFDELREAFDFDRKAIDEDAQRWAEMLKQGPPRMEDGGLPRMPSPWDGKTLLPLESAMQDDAAFWDEAEPETGLPAVKNFDDMHSIFSVHEKLQTQDEEREEAAGDVEEGGYVDEAETLEANDEKGAMNSTVSISEIDAMMNFD